MYNKTATFRYVSVNIFFSVFLQSEVKEYYFSLSLFVNQTFFTLSKSTYVILQIKNNSQHADIYVGEYLKIIFS
jgi:hypothetical protein